MFISCPLALSRFPLKTVFDLHFYHMVPTCDRRGVGVGVIVLFRILSMEGREMLELGKGEHRGEQSGLQKVRHTTVFYTHPPSITHETLGMVYTAQ